MCFSGGFFIFSIFVFISLSSEARESRYEEFLQPVFKEEVRSKAKNPENRRDKFKSNSLFDSKLDKTVKELSKTDHKVGSCLCANFSHNVKF